jgi:uncharacterized membrane protein
MPRQAGVRAARALSLIAALAAAGSAGAQDLPALYRVTGVDATDSLNVREAPDPNAAIVGTLEADAVDIEVVALSREGSWAEINFEDRAAWVAYRFLAEQNQKPWDDASVPLSCYGTEPFWSFELSGGAAVYDSAALGADPPRKELGRSSVRYHSKPTEDPVLGLDYADAFAVIRPAECSDGMSERANGLVIDLFFKGKDGLGGITGCCSLVR